MSDNSIIAPNRIKRALKGGQSVVGTMVVEFRQPSVMQLLANAGFDFVIVDNEHGPFGLETIADLTRAAKQLGLTPIVRIPDLTYPYIAQSLDSGAQGVMIPRVFNVEQVHQALQIMKYPPLGIRGNALSRGYTDFRSGPVTEAMAQANEETMLVIQIETQGALDNLEEIVSIRGVDVALIGPNDLSIALGVPGQMEHPRLKSAIQKTIDLCQQHHVFPAIHINSLELAVHWAKQGMRLVSSNAETGLMIRGGFELTSAISQAFEKNV
jgi:2-keto-3-deoxy-L-rhamnonate aldolase RhmA